LEAVATAVADPPVAPSEQQPPAGGVPGGPATPGSEPAQQPTASCAKCGAPLAAGQDWCLKCGAGGPDSLSSRAPTWRSAAVVLTALAILVAGAATAAYAALSKHDAKPPTTTVAQVPTTPAATTPVTPQPPETGGTATAKIGTPTTIAPSTSAKPPKIPLSAPTPTPATTTPVVPITPKTGLSTPTTTKSGGSNSAPVGEAHPEALLLDTNAASTYNPYNYAASNFGDPSLAIDGDRSTGWTAVVEPSVAPKMAEGLVIDLNTPRKLSALALITTTPGMTVQVYGANGEAPPTSITDPAWAALSPSLVEKKKHARIKFGGTTAAGQAAAKKAYRFVAVWVSQAPASAVGTPAAPGHISINEIELFSRKKS
jgi:hypothetical protein